MLLRHTRHVAAALAVLLLLMAAPASAQAVTLAWDMAPPPDTTDPAAALKAVNGYTYKYYVDASAVGQVLATVVCVGVVAGSGYTCAVPMPPLPIGAHTLTVTASTGTTTGTTESPKSNVLAFTVNLSAPTKLRVEPPLGR